MTSQAVRDDWILNWLERNFCADVLNQHFHEEYHQKFPEYKRRETNWGAQPVAQAMRDLSRLAASGILEAGRINLAANWQPGFPKSVISYSLPKNGK